MKSNLKKAGQALLRNNTSDILRHQFFKMKKKYKSAVIASKRQFKLSLYTKLETMSEENSKEH